MTTAGIIILKDRSTRFPDKNRCTLYGRPIYDFMLHTCQAARFDQVFVSTSSEFFKGVAEDYGIPWLDRPPKFDADDCDLGEHLRWAANQVEADVIAELTVSHPFIKPDSLDLCIEALREDPTLESAYTAYRVEQFAWIGNEPLNHDPQGKPRPRTQDRPPVWLDANHYFIRTKYARQHGVHHGSRRKRIEVSEIEAMDLHYPSDLKILEAVYQSGVVDWV